MTAKPSKPLLVNLTWGVGALLVLIVAWFLAFGLLTALHSRGMIPAATTPILKFCYRPLRLLYDHVPPSRRVIEDYRGLWIPDESSD